MNSVSWMNLKVIAVQQQAQPPPVMLSDQYELQVQLEQILSVKQGSSGNLEVFIKCLKIETCLSKRAVEIGKAKIQEAFPALHLNDNMALLRGIDRKQLQLGRSSRGEVGTIKRIVTS
ncbi:hypothetical protein A2U01_0004035 [Trifolium medium]|uniref:Uncharacterized protein n=1 Tax=Trifolium medium TaxID=97028 RepID=A0A392M6Y6_9FABA|nr:hypothetical protein [Trifolium medium]